MVTRRPLQLVLALVLLVGAACTAPPKTVPPPPAVGAPASAGTVGAGGFITPQQLAQQPGGLETVRIAYNTLLDAYYKPVKSNELLTAAWDGVVSEAQRQTGSDPGMGPKLTGDRNADFKAFSDSFNAAAKGDKAQYAFAAVNSMAQSLNDDHTFFLNQQQFRQRQNESLGTGPSSVFSDKLLPGNIGYLKLTFFPAGYAKLADGKTFSEDLDAALNDLERQGAKGWVIDLRNNPGGHTESIATLTGRFIPNGVVLNSVDAKGQPMQLPVDGHYFAHHHPLAVLINGGSGSSSEISASAFKEYGAGRLFGTKTAGAVNGAEELPLPGEVGLQYTVVQALTGKTRQPLDRVGVTPDQVVQTQAGRDSQLEAAEAWLSGPGASAGAAPGTPAPTTGVLPDAQIRSLLAPLGARVSDIPPLPQLRELGNLTVDTPNEYAQCAPRALDLAQTVIQRGWQGEYAQFFGNGDPFTYAVTIDAYRDVSGARQAIETNDFPTEFQNASVPVRIGEETVAQKGIVASLGTTRLSWRRGRFVFTAIYIAAPELESFDPLVQIAKAVDTRFEQNPVK